MEEALPQSEPQHCRKSWNSIVASEECGEHEVQIAALDAHKIYMIPELTTIIMSHEPKQWKKKKKQRVASDEFASFLMWQWPLLLYFFLSRRIDLIKTLAFFHQFIS